jgi:hypothetical protein
VPIYTNPSTLHKNPLKTLYTLTIDIIPKVWYNINTKEREEYTMKTIERTMHFPIFNPQVNDFYYERHDYSRPATKQEKEIHFRYCAMNVLFIVLIIVYAIGLFLALVTAVTWSDLLLIPITVAWAWLAAQILNYAFKLEDKICCFKDTGFEAEEMQYDQVAQEQNDIAEKWRAEHEFEELIRQAKLSANCTDIAKAAVYYAEHYIKGAE